MTQVGKMAPGTYIHYGHDSEVVRIVDHRAANAEWPNDATWIAREYPHIATQSQGHYIPSDSVHRRVSADIVRKKHTPPTPEQINLSTIAVMYNSDVSNVVVMPNMSSVTYDSKLVRVKLPLSADIIAVLHSGRLWYVETRGPKMLVSTMCHVERRY